MRAIAPHASFEMEIPSNNSITNDYQENNEIEIYKLYKMAVLIGDLLNFYNYKRDFYGKGVLMTKISVVIIFISIILTVVYSIL